MDEDPNVNTGVPTRPVIVIELVAVTCEHPPDAATVLVTVYVPGVLAGMLICPVLALTNTSPAVDVKVPAVAPVANVGEGLAAFLQ